MGLVVRTTFPWRRVRTALAGSTSCLQVHLCHANVCPLPPYLNISVTSPLASATRTGKPMQAGTRYRRAGWKKTQGGEAMLGRALAQGYAHHSTPFLGMTGSGRPGSQSKLVTGPEPRAPDSQTRAASPWQGRQETQRNESMQDFKDAQEPGWQCPNHLGHQVQPGNLLGWFCSQRPCFFRSEARSLDF